MATTRADHTFIIEQDQSAINFFYMDALAECVTCLRAAFILRAKLVFSTVNCCRSWESSAWRLSTFVSSKEMIDEYLRTSSCHLGFFRYRCCFSAASWPKFAFSSFPLKQTGTQGRTCSKKATNWPSCSLGSTETRNVSENSCSDMKQLTVCRKYNDEVEVLLPTLTL